MISHFRLIPRAYRSTRSLPQFTLLRALSISFLLASGYLTPGGESTADTHKIRIVLVGDSTVTDKAGWGLGFEAYVKDNVECINTAMGGRSSKSFMDEGRWTNALALHGDYYLIQFGHNNEPGKPGRSTDMTTFIDNMKTYVDGARQIGAKPILVTPLTRRQWDKSNYGKIKSSLQPYAQAVEKIAIEKKVPILDLHSRSIELCEKMGPIGCKAFSPLKSVDGTNTLDNTHLTSDGSYLFAGLVVAEIRQSVPDLAQYLRTEAMTNSQNIAHAEAAKADSQKNPANTAGDRQISSVKQPSDKNDRPANLLLK